MASAVYRGHVFTVEVDRVPRGDGSTREVAVVRHGPVVVLLPVRDDGRVVLIRQYRHALGRHIWEVPAGGVHPGEAPDAAAAANRRGGRPKVVNAKLPAQTMGAAPETLPATTVVPTLAAGGRQAWNHKF